MAQTLRTNNKQTGTPLEVAAIIRRLATPAILQPTYTFDVSDWYWYVFDGIDNSEQVCNGQYVNWYGVAGSHLVGGMPTKTGNIVYQPWGVETGYSIPKDSSIAYWNSLSGGNHDTPFIVNTSSGLSIITAPTLTGTGNTLTLYGGQSNTGTPGNLFLKGGTALAGVGGNVGIEGGAGTTGSGNVRIGLYDTSAIFMGALTNTSYAGTKKVIMIDTADKRLYYGDVSGGGSGSYAWSMTYPSIGVPVDSGDVVNFSDSSTVTVTGSKVSNQITLKFNAIGGSVSGTTNYVPKFINASTLGNSAIYEDTSINITKNVVIRGTDPVLSILSGGQETSKIVFNGGVNPNGTLAIVTDTTSQGAGNHIYSPSSSPLTFHYDDTSILTIDTALTSTVDILLNGVAGGVRKIKGENKTGSSTHAVDLVIEAGHHLGATAGVGGDITLKAGDVSQGTGGDVWIQGGVNTTSPTNPASMGSIAIGRTSNYDETAGSLHVGGVTNLAATQFVFINPSTGRLTYHTDTSTGTLGGLDASMNEITARTAVNEASIGVLDASKANLSSPLFLDRITIGGWTFATDASDNLTIQHGHTAVMKFTTDGSILLKTTPKTDASFGEAV